MNCAKVQSHLSAFLDGELSGHDMLAFRQHLSRCPACGQEEASLKAIKQILADGPLIPCSSDFEDRLINAVMVKITPAPAPKRWWLARFGFAAASVCALALVIVAMNTSHAPSRAPLPLSAMASNAPSQTSVNDSGPKRELPSNLERESAYLQSSDPLSGPAMTVAATYAHP